MLNLSQLSLHCRELEIKVFDACPACLALFMLCQYSCRERSGSVVECLTRDRRAAGSSLWRHCVVVLEQDTFILA